MSAGLKAALAPHQKDPRFAGWLAAICEGLKSLPPNITVTGDPLRPFARLRPGEPWKTRRQSYDAPGAPNRFRLDNTDFGPWLMRNAPAGKVYENAVATALKKALARRFGAPFAPYGAAGMQRFGELRDESLLAANAVLGRSFTPNCWFDDPAHGMSCYAHGYDEAEQHGITVSTPYGPEQADRLVDGIAAEKDLNLTALLGLAFTTAQAWTVWSYCPPLPAIVYTVSPGTTDTGKLIDPDTALAEIATPGASLLWSDVIPVCRQRVLAISLRLQTLLSSFPHSTVFAA
jgi:hypothetical protein